VTDPAGWYPDPQGTPKQLRYWDGRRWTQFAVMAPEPPTFPAYGSDDTTPTTPLAPDATRLDRIPTENPVGRGWRIRHSLWILAPILGFGFLSFVGFAYCAARVRTRAWTVTAIGTVLLTIIGYILIGAWTDATGSPTTAATVYMIDLWLASIAFAFIVNRDYLAWRAERP
jgi:hypothetical protein